MEWGWYFSFLVVVCALGRLITRFLFIRKKEQFEQFELDRSSIHNEHRTRDGEKILCYFIKMRKKP